MKAKQPRALLILYATQTGNAMDAAERIGREAERRGCSILILSMDEYDASSLPSEDAVIFVVSTTGQGDAPDSMKFVAKKLDKRLSDLGAVALVERGLGDDQHPSGYEGALDPWMSSLWRMLNKIYPNFFPNGPDHVKSEMRLLDQQKVEVRYQDINNVDPQFSVAADLKSREKNIELARSMSLAKFSDKSRPCCFLKMMKNQLLTKAGSGKDVRHFEFELVSSAIKYEIGDVLEVLPSQNPAAVDAFMQRCNLNPESFITVHPRKQENGIYSTDLDVPRIPIKLRTFVELAMDVSSASPRRYFFEVMSFFATAEHEKERLQYFVSPEGRDDLYQYNQKERRTVLEVLEDFPSVQMPFEWLVQLVPPLKTRAFSISSSPMAHPNQVHLTVNVVSWRTPFKRKRYGLCSSWLANLNPHESTVILAWFQKGCLPPPPPLEPLILIGPGTGCAPFRGFVEERSIQSHSSKVAPVMFFFGCRNEENDFLYQDFWSHHSREEGGVLSEVKGGGFFMAFSRDQPQKVYVQHKMRENSQRVWDLLSDGAAVYVAGSSTKMPSDVLEAFEEIISKESGLPRESAVRWIRALERAGKYHVEAWS